MDAVLTKCSRESRIPEGKTRWRHQEIQHLLHGGTNWNHTDVEKQVG